MSRDLTFETEHDLKVLRQEVIGAGENLSDKPVVYILESSLALIASPMEWSMVIRFIFIVVATAAYLGLAVLGWGGFAAFFSHPALVALTVTLFTLAGAFAVCWGKSEPGSARRSQQPVGARSAWTDRTIERLSSGLC